MGVYSGCYPLLIKESGNIIRRSDLRKPDHMAMKSVSLKSSRLFKRPVQELDF